MMPTMGVMLCDATLYGERQKETATNKLSMCARKVGRQTWSLTSVTEDFSTTFQYAAKE